MLSATVFAMLAATALAAPKPVAPRDLHNQLYVQLFDKAECTMSQPVEPNQWNATPGQCYTTTYTFPSYNAVGELDANCSLYIYPEGDCEGAGVVAPYEDGTSVCHDITGGSIQIVCT